MQDVMLTIKTTQEVDGGEETTELITRACMQAEGQAVTLTYRETQEDGSPMTTTIWADLSRSPVQVELARIGTHDSRMTVEQGKRHHSLYAIGPCEFALGVYGELVDCRLNERGGRLRMRYTLDINAAYAGRNTLDISVNQTDGNKGE